MQLDDRLQENQVAGNTARRRIREWIEIPDRFEPGPRNSIADVPSVTVGHRTIIEADSIRTGVTVLLPHDGDPHLDRCPAAVYAANGFGKLTGALQILELGELESLIALTNTLSVPQAMQGLLDYHLATMPANAISINLVVGETNDGYLNDIKGCHVRPEHVIEAIGNASQDVMEGCVGAGTGTVCFGYKGGMGTASRVVPADAIDSSDDVNLGALVQTNYGGNLTVYGRPIPGGAPRNFPRGGSCMIVVATDAPLDSRQLTRLARRGIVGLTRTGSNLAHESGDFCIAFSNGAAVRRQVTERGTGSGALLADDLLSPVFDAVIEVVTEALYNSLTMAVPTLGFRDRRVEAFNPADFSELLQLRPVP